MIWRLWPEMTDFSNAKASDPFALTLSLSIPPTLRFGEIFTDFENANCLRNYGPWAKFYISKFLKLDHTRN